MTDAADLLLRRRPAWPGCKVAGCANEAALGGACAELHGGAAPTRTPGGYVLFQHWPEPGEDSLDPERWEPLPSGDWQCWCVSRTVWDRWAVDGAWPPTPEAAPGRVPRFATRGGLGAPQPLRPRAARELLREERVSLVALQDQLEASNVFFPGLFPDPGLLALTLPLLRLAHRFTEQQAAELSAAWRLAPLMPELAPFARDEPEPAPREWPQHRVRPPSHRARLLPLDAFAQHAEWSLPSELIDLDPEMRLIQQLDSLAVER